MKAASLKFIAALAIGTLLFSTAGLSQKKIDRVDEDETSIRAYLDKGKLDDIEGIYKSYNGQFYKIAIKKYDYYYIAIVLDSYDKSKWKTGMVKAYFEESAEEGTYAMTWIMGDKSRKETIAKMEDEALLKFVLPLGEFGERTTVKFLKLYPKNKN
jgi:hypothetical protein